MPLEISEGGSATTTNTLLTSIDATLGGIYSNLAAMLNFTFDLVRNKSLIMIDESHSFIHGDSSLYTGYFVVCADEAVVSSGGGIVDCLMLDVPGDESKAYHLTFNMRFCADNLALGGYTVLKFYEGADVSANTEAEEWDRNRVRDQKCDLVVYTDPIVASEGTLIYHELYGYPAGKGDHAHDKMEFILKPGLKYLLRLENTSKSDSYCQVIINWYEPHMPT